jgi:hypothetical protein
MPRLLAKCRENLATLFPAGRVEEFMQLCLDLPRLQATPVDEFMDRLVVE